MILRVYISGFLHGKKKIQHHEVPNAEILKPRQPSISMND
jgi:hypothetical protein